MGKKYWMTETTKEDANYGSEYYPDEISESLCNLAKKRKGYMPDGQDYEDCMEALYQLKAACENEYNKDYYRTLYKILAKVTYVLNCR